MFDWAYIVALSLSMADAGIACRDMNNGRVEANPLVIHKSCTGLVAQKLVLLNVPLLIPNKNWRMTVKLMNIAGSSYGIGLTITLKLNNK